MRPAVLAIVSAVALLAAPPRAWPNVLVVNRDTGGIAWLNATGDVLDVAGYTLQSPTGGLRPSDWLSISEHYDADSGGALDANDVWVVLGSSPSDLSEATTGTTSIGDGALVDLGMAWTPGHPENATFEYLDAILDEVRAGGVLFVSNVAGDFNGNGLVEQGDLDLVLTNWGRGGNSIPPAWFQDFPRGFVDQEELDRVLVNWGVPGLTLPPPVGVPFTAARVPEPSTLVLSLSAAFGGLVAWRRWRRLSPNGACDGLTLSGTA